MILNGLTEFQRALLSASRNSDKAFEMAMRTSGNAATRQARKTGRRLVNKVTGNYQKGFKRGKVFKDPNGYLTVRVLNTSPHSHLVEYGSRIVDKEGNEHGFRPGKFVLKKAIEEYESTQDFIQELSKALDKLLEQNRL